MKFNIVLGNHSPSVINTTRDHTLIIKGGLQDAGHFAQLSQEDVFRDEINLFYDFLGKESVGHFQKLRADGYDYGLISTEILQGGTINYGTNEGIRARIAATKEVAKHARFVWVMHEPSLENFKALCGHNRCYYLPLGHTPSIQELRFIPYEERDIDFLFFGFLTDYRKAILEKLKNTEFQVRHVYNVAGFIRNSMIERTKINLSLRQTATWDQPSVGRISYLVGNRASIITEQTTNGAPYENYTISVPPENFVERCIEVRLSGKYADLAVENADAFARDYPLGAMFKEVIAQTFVGSGGRSA